MNYRVSAMCEECQAHDMGFILGRNGSDAEPLLLALAKGWEVLHPGHQQIIVVSPKDEGEADDAK